MKYTLHLLVFTLLVTPLALFAQGKDYVPLVGLPGAGGSTLGSGSSFEDYINAMYALSIGIAALLAVIKIIIAGVKWMVTDIVPSKEEAKKDIKGALLGLIVVLSAVLILNVINPNLTKATINLKPAPNYSSGGNPSVTPTFNSGSVLSTSGPGYTIEYLPLNTSAEQKELFAGTCSFTMSTAGQSAGAEKTACPQAGMGTIDNPGRDIRIVKYTTNKYQPMGLSCDSDNCDTTETEKERVAGAQKTCEDGFDTPQAGRDGIFVRDPIYPKVAHCFY